LLEFVIVKIIGVAFAQSRRRLVPFLKKKPEREEGEERNSPTSFIRQIVARKREKEKFEG
jgi:hypothetical protein